MVYELATVTPARVRVLWIELLIILQIVDWYAVLEHFIMLRDIEVHFYMYRIVWTLAAIVGAFIVGAFIEWVAAAFKRAWCIRQKLH